MTPKQLALLLDRDEERRRAADRRAGEIVATLSNIHVDRTKRPDGFTWLDVFPEWKEPEPAQTEEQMYQTMLLWTRITKRKSA